MLFQVKTVWSLDRIFEKLRCFSVLSSALIVFMITSCVSVQPISNFSLPATIEPFFGSCDGSDGALDITLHYEDDFLGQTTMEWVSDNSGWRSELYNPIGQTILAIGYYRENKKIDSTGVLKDKLPLISLLPDNFLEVDGYFVPLKGQEIGCLLNHKWPRSWLQTLIEVEQNSESLALHFREPDRSIKLTFIEYKRFSNRKSCAELHWSALWGLVDSQFIICINKNRQQTAEAFDIAGYKLKWGKKKD